jgi:hypothetical protein
VLPVTLCLSGSLHSFLDSLMSPAKTPFRRTSDFGEFNRFEPVGELCRHHLSNGSLTHSTGTGNQEKHKNLAWKANETVESAGRISTG